LGKKIITKIWSMVLTTISLSGNMIGLQKIDAMTNSQSLKTVDKKKLYLQESIKPLIFLHQNNNHEFLINHYSHSSHSSHVSHVSHVSHYSHYSGLNVTTPSPLYQSTQPNNGVTNNVVKIVLKDSNLRSGPGISYSIITIVKKDQLVIVNKFKNGWYEVLININVDSLVVGWIYGELLGDLE